MSFKKVFKKKPGGSSFGNLLRGVASIGSSGALGQGLNKIELGQTKTNKELSGFAGQSATFQDETYSITKPLPEVSVSALRNGSTLSMPEKIGNYLEPIFSKATQGATVGADDRTLMIVGLGILGIVGAIFYTRK